jgi:hypothetical protein
VGLTIIPRAATDDATLSSEPAAVAALPVSNLQLSDRGLVARWTAATVEIKANLPAPRRVGGVVLWRHALTTAATWRVRIYDGIDFTGALQYDSTVTAAVPAKTLGDLDWGIDPLGAAVDGADFSDLTLPADVVCRSIRINVVDTAAATIEIGRLFAGPLIRPEIGFGWDSEISWQRETRRTRMAGGGLRVESTPPWRRMHLQLDWISDAERTAFANLLRDTGDSRELWISARGGAGGRVETDHAMLGVLAGNEPLTRRQGLRHTLPIEIEEA